MTSLKLAKTQAMRAALRREMLEFLRTGLLENVSVDLLAQRLNVAKATIYNYYPTKDALLADTAQELYQQFADLYRVRLQQQLPPAEKIADCLNALLDIYDQYGNVYRQIFHQTWQLASAEIRVELTCLAQQEITKELKRGIEQGIFIPTAHPEELAFALLSTAQGMIRHIAFLETPYTTDDCRRIFRDIVLAPLRAVSCRN